MHSNVQKWREEMWIRKDIFVNSLPAAKTTCLKIILQKQGIDHGNYKAICEGLAIPPPLHPGRHQRI
jgi:hypothetical protein